MTLKFSLWRSFEGSLFSPPKKIKKILEIREWERIWVAARPKLKRTFSRQKFPSGFYGYQEAKPQTLTSKSTRGGTSLVAQWLRIRLPTQGTWVRALVQEDPTCRGATKPVCHNCWACALEPVSHNYWAHVPQLLKPTRLEPVLCNGEATAMRSPHTATKSSPRSLQLEKPRKQQQRPKRRQK